MRPICHPITRIPPIRPPKIRIPPIVLLEREYLRSFLGIALGALGIALETLGSLVVTEELFSVKRLTKKLSLAGSQVARTAGSLAKAISEIRGVDRRRLQAKLRSRSRLCLRRRLRLLKRVAS